jgi:hypothetical protein
MYGIASVDLSGAADDAAPAADEISGAMPGPAADAPLSPPPQLRTARLATNTGLSIVLLDDAPVSLGWLRGVFSLECRASPCSSFTVLHFL